MALIYLTLLLLILCISTDTVYMGRNNENRPPGTLLLNMLIKNEAEHLRRTLPKWAKIIDAWIIGVDDANTDNSVEVIKEILGHIPGEVVIVHFDGMGPTWNELVQIGIENYPQITHGIIADADYMPMQDKLDKIELDIRCSKHMYTIFTEDHQNERRMDWIYRNVPGAKVSRRTHQTVDVPPFPDQEVFQTLINLNVEERAGGYQDRSGKKNENYIKFLEADLVDYPNDPRTLYYLGYANYDIFNANKDKPTQAHWDKLALGVKYFIQRTNTPGNQEEGWFAHLKLGEIYERFYRDWNKALPYYESCAKEDPERADPFFYIGQHYRLSGEFKKAIPYLLKASLLPIPSRSLFNWHYMYNCLTKLELSRAVNAIKDTLSNQEYRDVLNSLKLAICESSDSNEIANVRTYLEGKISVKNTKNNEKVTSVKKLVNFIGKGLSTLEELLPAEYYNAIFEFASDMQDFLENGKGKTGDCRDYRRATTPYLKYMKLNSNKIEEALDDRVYWENWNRLTLRFRSICR